MPKSAETCPNLLFPTISYPNLPKPAESGKQVNPDSFLCPLCKKLHAVAYSLVQLRAVTYSYMQFDAKRYSYKLKDAVTYSFVQLRALFGK